MLTGTLPSPAQVEDMLEECALVWTKQQIQEKAEGWHSSIPHRRTNTLLFSGEAEANSPQRDNEGQMELAPQHKKQWCKDPNRKMSREDPSQSSTLLNLASLSAPTEVRFSKHT